MNMLETALTQIVNEVRDGLRHGHFEFAITSEKVAKGSRRLVLKAGKSHQYIITEDDLKN